MSFQTLNLLFQCGKAFGHKRIKNHGLSDTECFLCSYVYSHPGCTQDDAVQALRMDKTTAAKALRTLESKELIRREQDTADRRKKVLQITESGVERISAVADLHERWFRRVLSVLSEEEQAQFEHYCLRLLRAAEALPPEPETEESRLPSEPR